MITQFFIYLLEVSICLAGFWGFYRLFLHRRNHFNWNRAYLLMIVPISLIVPLINITIDQDTTPITALSDSWSQIVEFDEPLEELENPIVPQQKGWKIPSWPVQLLIIYLGGILWAGIKFTRSMAAILKRVYYSTGEKKVGYYLLESDDPHIAFSFFNFIFLGQNFRSLSIEDKQSIIEHEKVHAIHLHSIDIILFELLGVIFWFNPIIRSIKSDLSNVHEFIADQNAAANLGLHNYSRLVIELTSKAPSTGLQFANHFALLSLRNRITMMLNKKRDKKIIFLSTIPLVVISMAFFSFKSTPYAPLIPTEPVIQKNLISWVKQEDPFKPSIRPVDALVVSAYGMRMHPVKKVRKLHWGCDFWLDIGEPIYATADGLVKFEGSQRNGYGIHLRITHGDSGYETLYAHMSKTNVSEGDEVKRGDIIGFVGNSGLSKRPHLHYEVMKNGKRGNPQHFFPARDGETVTQKGSFD